MKDLLAQQIQNFFITQNLTLSIAESCTGGALAARLTKVPGCSNYFTGAVVSYSNTLKLSLLGIDSLILSTNGAISGPVAEQMVEGMLRLSGSHYSVAVTGIAGPDGGTDLKPVGTIWAAIGKRSTPSYVWDFRLNGSREEIIEQTVETVLSKLWTLLPL